MKKQIEMLLFVFLLGTITNQTYRSPCNSKDINSYKCSDVDMKGKCMIKDYQKENDVETTTYLLKNCGSSENCQFFDKAIGYNKYEYGVCLKKNLIKFEGEKCSENSECYSNSCQKNKCVVLLKGEKCNSTNECANGLFCFKDANDNKICQDMAKENEKCDINIDNCPIGYLCGNNSKDQPNPICLPMFTIEDGMYSNRNLLCKSGFAVDKQPPSFLQPYTYSPFQQVDVKANDPVCAKSKLVSNEKCTKDDDCEFEITGFTNRVKGSFCICSVNGIDSYCDITTDNQLWTDWITKYTQVLKDVEINDLKHILYDSNNGYGSGQLKILNNKVHNYALIKNGDECALNYFTSAYNNNVSLLSLLLFLFILIS